MNVKLGQILDSIEVLKELNNRGDIPIGVSFNLTLTSKAVESILATYEEKRKVLIGKYTTPITEKIARKDENGKDVLDAEGNVVMVEQELAKFNDEDANIAFVTELNSLLGEDVELSIKFIKISSFPASFTISANKLMGLSWLLSEE